MNEVSEVKVYLIKGIIRKPNFLTTFRKEVRALNSEDAIEKVYKTLGSKHKVKRFHIKIEKVELIENEQNIV
jgi:large subunit ribosomal protein LX